MTEHALSPKILLVFTGGTIGSSVKNKIAGADENAKYKLLNEFYKIYANKPNFDIIQPLNILSENITPYHWGVLANAIITQGFDKYKGVIIAHGTDTLPYTSAFFSFLFGAAGVPIVFVSSNRPVGKRGSNAVVNFCAAVDFILGYEHGGVYSIFEHKKTITVYLGTRLIEMDNRDRFSSYNNIDFGAMINGIFVPNKTAGNPSATEIKQKPTKYPKPISIRNTIFRISPYPGLDYNVFDFSQTKPVAILHDLYHSSTAATGFKDNSLICFTEKCEKLGIDLYLRDCKHITNGVFYDTSKAISKRPIQLLSYISREAAFAKLYAAYNTEESPISYMQNDIFYEHFRAPSAI